MTTMAQAIRQYVQTSPTGVTSADIKTHINAQHPGRWTPGTLTAHLYGCAVNQPKAYRHHPSAEKFLYKTDDGRFQIYDEAIHGPNVWAPGAGGNEIDDEEIEQLIETSISLERDVEEHLIRNLESLEKGLRFVGRQEVTEVGRIDILAEDASGRRVVIELKVGEAKDAAIGQIARYLGYYARTDGKPPRGMLIASEFPEPVRYAAEAVRDLALITYRVQFAFDRATLES
ncbi:MULTISPECIES: endonuclease NucS domain-containing protein [Caballeronia]|uniref:endonuclease NucS domain-containing protein n=1 Tax=Caballeronia TaxID=1827195 RepID=UPI001FD5C09E|nr:MULTISPECIES: endonuclease NucS domain-containing protein [Caballeronia]MDR5798968.1 endonuclease NucS [Caballeronia sp. LZ001]